MKTEKYCPSCKATLEVSCFSKNAARHDGLQHYCKKCSQEKYKARYMKKRKQYLKEYAANRAGDPDVLETVKLQKIKYQQTHEGMVKWLYQLVRGRVNAKARKGKVLEFTITEEWISDHLKPMVCEATGVPLQYPPLDGARIPFRPSIDKIDPLKGYTPENCQVVCWMYNLAKNRFTNEDVLTMASYMVNFNKAQR